MDVSNISDEDDELKELRHYLSIMTKYSEEYKDISDKMFDIIQTLIPLLSDQGRKVVDNFMKNDMKSHIENIDKIGQMAFYKE